MLHRRVVVALTLALLPAGPAFASFTIDLIWSGTSSPTLTVAPATANVSPAEAPCGSGAPSAAGPGRCLTVRVTAAAPFLSANVNVGWSASGSGIALDHVGARSFGQFGGGPPGANPATPGPVDPSPCGFCDTAYGPFGGATPASIPAGTFVVGSLNFDLAGAHVGTHAIAAFASAGTGGVIDAKNAPAPVQINGAILNVIPEPGTALLTGIGIALLAASARTRR